MRKFRISNIILIVSVLTLQACLVKNILYQQIDWLAIRQFNETFAPTDEQSKIFEPQIKSWVNSVKFNVFEKVAEGFSNAAQQTQDSYSKAELLQFEQTMLEARKIFMLPGISIASKFLKSLSDEQLNAFLKKMQEKEEQFTEIIEADQSEFAELRDERVEEIEDRMDFWIGEMTKKQSEFTRDFWWKDIKTISQRLERRHKLQQKLISIIKTSDEKQLSAFFMKWADDIDHLNNLTFPNEKIRPFSMRRYFSALVKTLNPKQKQVLEERLAEIAKDLKGVLN